MAFNVPVNQRTAIIAKAASESSESSSRQGMKLGMGILLNDTYYRKDRVGLKDPDCLEAMVDNHATD